MSIGSATHAVRQSPVQGRVSRTNHRGLVAAPGLASSYDLHLLRVRATWAGNAANLAGGSGYAYFRMTR